MLAICISNVIASLYDTIHAETNFLRHTFYLSTAVIQVSFKQTELFLTLSLVSLVCSS